MKNKTKNRLFGSVRILTVSAFLVALSIICGKYLQIPVGNVMRFSLENLPILFAGFAFGPVVGALVGTVADLIGCVLVGYTVNPVVTLGAALIGAVGGLAYLALSKIKLPTWLRVLIAVALAHAVGSVAVKTLGLAAFYDMPYHILLLWRSLNYLIVAILESSLLFMLFENKTIEAKIASIKPKKP